MALDFAAQIHALSGFNADGTDDTSTDDDFDETAAQWMSDGAREVINLLPQKLKEKCMTATGVGTDSIVDLDSMGEILYVTRKNDDAGHYTECRKIPSSHGGLATDSTNIIHYATATDPVYWVDGDTSGAATLYVKPTPTSGQPSIVHHIGYPTFTAADDGALDIVIQSTIPNFPDEAEYLVVLYAAIKATEYMMLTEEDPEVYAPQLTTLKQDYAQGISSLTGAPKRGGE